MLSSVLLLQESEGSNPSPVAHVSESDPGTHTSISNPTATQIENLAILAKVWGFLKYHHPRVVSGDLQWDSELLRIIPVILKAKNAAARNELLLGWARSLGEPDPCNPCVEPSENARFVSHVNWIYDEQEIGAELSRYISRVYKHRLMGAGQYYVGKYGAPTYRTFTNESAYEELSEADTGLRLLALFRYWNIIEYWFPYRDVIGESWENVLREFIPRFVDAITLDAYALELRKIIARIHDSHAGLANGGNYPPFGDCVLPIGARFIEGQATVIAYTNDVAGPNSGINIGDTVLLIDGKPLVELIAEWRPFYAASNDAALYKMIGFRMTRGPCGKTMLTVGRGQGTIEIVSERIPRKEISLDSVLSHDRKGESFQLLADDVAYLKLSNVRASDIAGYIEAAQSKKGLIVDIRNYPSEFVVFELGQRLVKNAVPFALFTYRDLNNPGTFVWPNIGSMLRPAEPNYDGKVVVLVDELTQSQAEFTVMALQAGPNTVVIGSTTAGTNGDIAYIPLPGGMQTAISGAGVFYADKSPMQRIGIVPDIFVSPTVAGFRQGRDEVLERALEEILGRRIDDEILNGSEGDDSE